MAPSFGGVSEAFGSLQKIGVGRMSAFSGSQHLNSGGRDYADVPSPMPAPVGKRAYERIEIPGCGRMNPEQNHAGMFQRSPALNGDLTEVLVERQYDSLFGFGEIQKVDVFPAGAIGAGPKDVVAGGAE
jgi:hypothetical protein